MGPAHPAPAGDTAPSPTRCAASLTATPMRKKFHRHLRHLRVRRIRGAARRVSAGRRDHIVLATKFTNDISQKAGILATGNSRKTMVAASLKRLRTDLQVAMFSHASRIWTKVSGTYSAAMVSNGPRSLATSARRFSRNCEACRPPYTRSKRFCASAQCF